VGINLGIPVVVGVDHATSLFKNGQEITVDATHGVIYNGYASVL
ncbi:PEP-utilizing enzyme, partial [Planococcus sp. SIMBA_143]